MSHESQASQVIAGDIIANIAQLPVSSRDRKSVQAVSKLSKAGERAKWPKSDSRHWKSRLFKNWFTRNGARQETADWCVKIAHLGRRELFNLRTPNAEAAASKAAKIYLRLIGAGWEAAIAEYKPESVKTLKPATVGSLIETVSRLSSARRVSLEAYAKALRRIAAGVLHLDDAGKHGFKRGSQAWREKVDGTPLDRLSPSAVLAWKNAFLKAAKTPEERNAAAVTVNSLLRNSKALLSKKVRRFAEAELVLPSPLWFEGVSLEKEPNLRYRSQIDAGKILEAATRELAESQTEAFKALLLCLVCGLRRSEADVLLWSQIDLDAGTLEIRDTEHKALKSADSAGVIALDAELVSILRGYRAADKNADFVLAAPASSRMDFAKRSGREYRCNHTFKALVTWLQSKGVPGHRPIHTLRKEIGSVIATRDGIFAASRYLRHSGIAITAKIYADTKTLVSAGLGSLLNASAPNVIEADFRSQEETAPTARPARKRGSRP